MDLHWKRTVNDRAIADAQTIEREYELSLFERSREVIDVVRPHEGAATNCEGVAIEAEFVYRDAADLENSLLQYDVWLLQTDASGKQFTDHVEPRGFQGRDIELTFRRQRYNQSGALSAAGDVSVSLGGTVKGRMRPDGRIDLVLGMSRTVWHGSLGQGDGGSKQETVADGETIELELPRVSGNLAGTRTALRVTARRIG